MNEESRDKTEDEKDSLPENVEEEAEDFLSGICPYNAVPEDCESCQ